MFLHLAIEKTILHKGKLTECMKTVAQSLDTPEYRQRLLDRAINGNSKLLDSDCVQNYSLYLSPTNKITLKSKKIY